MPTDVGESPQLPVFASQQDERLARQIEGEVVAGIGEGVGGVHGNPVALEDLLGLELEDVWIFVHREGEGVSLTRGRAGDPPEFLE